MADTDIDVVMSEAVDNDKDHSLAVSSTAAALSREEAQNQ